MGPVNEQTMGRAIHCIPNVSGAVKEHPILFKGELVRAILDGRKTVTRRVVKDAPSDADSAMRCVAAETCIDMKPGSVFWRFGVPGGISEGFRCPYGVPGDRLWVREALRCSDCWRYAADDVMVVIGNLAEAVGWAFRNEKRHCPSIHMPRWASRITLEVTDVRVERLQEISTLDAMAEGVAPVEAVGVGPSYTRAFHLTWDRINGKRAPWDSNPWVWRVEFRRVQQ